ncbi:unnamed protein product [Cyprideis torosa]|uniref:Uncharacterized protein n=1 Tax=Cyprideis torosa TaxID=163714 RepID=A0A7R8WFF6_9CRUS|nr:unnamed protein product [Cyprideis torosa]CAG0891427.1 unnamed protein product [Cyprideis torosa]
MLAVRWQLFMFVVCMSWTCPTDGRWRKKTKGEEELQLEDFERKRERASWDHFDVTVDTRPSWCTKRSRLHDVITYQFANPPWSPDMIITSNYVLDSNSIFIPLEKALLGMCLGEIRKITNPAAENATEASTEDFAASDEYYRLVRIRPRTSQSMGSVQYGIEVRRAWDDPFLTSFELMDGNRDLRLTRTEIVAHTTNELLDDAKRGAGLPYTTEEAVKVALNMSSRLFSQSDENQDGLISVGEFLRTQHFEYPDLGVFG